MPKSIAIANKCLRDFYKIRSIPLIEKEAGVWTLNYDSTSGTTQDEKNHNYVLWSFPFSEGLNPVVQRNPPIHFSFIMKIAPNDKIQEVNIKIFKENVIIARPTPAMPTELLLRVEWSNISQGAGAEYIHAQPHWHVHTYKYVDFNKNLTRQDQELLKQFIEESQANDSIGSKMDGAVDDSSGNQNAIAKMNNRDIPPYKFHLAMLAEWDKPDSLSHEKELSNDVLELWLPQCLSYIKGQLEYVLKRSGNSIT
jgi:hypothetical protein